MHWREKQSLNFVIDISLTFVETKATMTRLPKVLTLCMKIGTGISWEWIMQRVKKTFLDDGISLNVESVERLKIFFKIYPYHSTKEKTIICSFRLYHNHSVTISLCLNIMFNMFLFFSSYVIEYLVHNNALKLMRKLNFRRLTWWK